MNTAKFTAEKNVLTVERTFNAPIQLVWQAWTEAEFLDKWWAPTPWKSETASMNFIEGGSRLYAMVSPEGEKHWGLSEYEIIEPVTKFGGSDVFCDEDGKANREMPVAKFTNTFTAAGDKTTMKMVTVYASESDLQAVIKMGMEHGLTMTMNYLDEIFETMNK